MKTLLVWLCVVISLPVTAVGTRITPPYSFTVTPQNVQTSYYDYFFSSYSTLPLISVPEADGGGYLLTYHARTSQQALRRTYLAKISSSGVIAPNALAGNVTQNEGFPALVYDEQTGLIFNAWHCNLDADSQSEIVVKTSYIGGGFPAPIDNPMIAINAPYTLNETSDNAFLWAQLAIGASPIQGLRRLYVLGSNSVSHTTMPTSNVLIAYIDFNSQGFIGDDGWVCISIPELDAWSFDNNTWRRTFLSLAADESGRVYVAGYHYNDNPDIGMELHVFVNNSYGTGTWLRVSQSSAMTVNNPIVHGSTWLGDDQTLDFCITNSTHLNAIVDGDNHLQVSGTWALVDGQGSYYPAFQYIKQYVYDPVTDQINLREVFPISANPNTPFTPWDNELPWGEIDHTMTDGTPIPFIYSPYCHWDASLHNNTMMFQYNNVKTTRSNAYGMQATVWQDTVSVAGINSSRINVALSSDNGETWSLPLKISSATNPEMQSQIPMWASPSDQITFDRYHNGRPEGKLGIVYFDDNVWGCEVLDSAPLQGGSLMFCELKVSCPPHPMPVGSLTLHVQDELGEPLSEASVSLGEWTYQTDAQGNLSLPELGFSTWDLAVSAFGFYTHNAVIEIVAGQELVQTISLQPLPPVTLTGIVRSNDIPNMGLEGVNVSLTSPYAYETVTNASGCFSIPGLRCGRSYEISLDREFYSSWQGSGLVLEHDFTLPDIILNELAQVPSNVTAVLNTNTSVVLTWDSLEGKEERLLSAKMPEKSLSSNAYRYPTGYRIYLIDEEDLASPNAWTTLYVGQLTDNQYEYTGWSSLSPGTYYWGVSRTYNTGLISPAGVSNPLARPVSNDDSLIPEIDTAIVSLSPNPFTSIQSISYSIEKQGDTSLSIYNLKGQKVRILDAKDLPAGFHNAVWDGRDESGSKVGSGVYLIVLRSSDKVLRQRAVLIRR